MATEHIVMFPSQPNVYNGEPRKCKVYYSLPDAGVTRTTGILLLIPGYGAMTTSKVYQKMRAEFPDKYNLITIQCDYFGTEFMQNNDSFSLDIKKNLLMFPKEEINPLIQLLNAGKENEFSNALKNIASRCNIQLQVKANINETINNFNDMGLMQALDNITAVYSVIKTLKNNGLIINTDKVIAYGYSHGAYISYLCNALEPTLFKLIIDNSAWLYPRYLDTNRTCISEIYCEKPYSLEITYDYIMSTMERDEDFLNLCYLYKLISNSAKIISFQGTTDTLIKSEDKKLFCSMLKCEYHLISEKDVDRQIFKSTNHGLDADFLKHFDYVMTSIDMKFGISDTMDMLPKQFQTRKYVYLLEYYDGIPILTRIANS